MHNLLSYNFLSKYILKSSNLSFFTDYFGETVLNCIDAEKDFEQSPEALHEKSYGKAEGKENLNIIHNKRIANIMPNGEN